MSNQIWCFLRKNFEIFFWGLNICKAKSGVSSFRGGGGQIKVAQNVLKHALVLKFLSSNEFFVGGGGVLKIKVA